MVGHLGLLGQLALVDVGGELGGLVIAGVVSLDAATAIRVALVG